jgi:hypothetical protein
MPVPLALATSPTCVNQFPVHASSPPLQQYHPPQPPLLQPPPMSCRKLTGALYEPSSPIYLAMVPRPPPPAIEEGACTTCRCASSRARYTARWMDDCHQTALISKAVFQRSIKKKSEMPIDQLGGVGTDPLPGRFQFPTPLTGQYGPQRSLGTVSKQAGSRFLKIDRWKTAFEIYRAPENQGKRPRSETAVFKSETFA